MTCSRYPLPAFLLAVAGLALAGCAGWLPSWESPPPPPVAAPPPPPSLRPEDIVGRWGLASFHKPEDRARTEAAARGQCRQPYNISSGPTGGVMMLLHDSPKVQELTIKASTEGKTYIGPGPEAGAGDDREVLSFDGRVLILKWVDPEVAGRYGTMAFVRCAPEGTARPKRAAK